MSERRDHDRKKSKRRRKDRDDDDDIVRSSGVNYSKVADRHVDDDRYEKHRGASTEAGTPAAASEPAESSKAGGVSAQMAAVMRVMAGQGERTIAEKLADSNRPTWEQYKKDNEDKLNIAGLDQKKMEEYRKQLDEQREKLLHRGTNHRDEGRDKKSKKKKKRKDYSSSSDDSYSSDSDRRDRKKKKHRKRKKKSRHHRDDDSYSSDSRDDRKRSKHHKKKKDKKKKRDDESGSGSDGYRLSAFFTKGSDDDESK